MKEIKFGKHIVLFEYDSRIYKEYVAIFTEDELREFIKEIKATVKK